MIFHTSKAPLSARMQPPPQYGCVVSVGCGVYPPDPIGDFNIQKFMTMSWEATRIHKFFPILQNLLKLLGNAVSWANGVWGEGRGGGSMQITLVSHSILRFQMRRKWLIIVVFVVRSKGSHSTDLIQYLMLNLTSRYCQLKLMFTS